MLILGLPADELVLRDAGAGRLCPRRAAPPRRGPSLLGRMLGWKFILFSLVAGLGFSYATQPVQTTRLFEQILRLFGA